MDYGNDLEDARTLFCGNLHPKVTEDLLYELFLQAGPLQKVRIPNDREGRPAAYGFITYKQQCSVPYALNLFENIELFKCRLNLRPRKMENYISNPPGPGCNSLLQMGTQINFNANPMPPVQNNYNQNRTPSGRQDYYRNESLQGRWSNYGHKRDRDNMRPNDNHRHNHKRHKR